MLFIMCCILSGQVCSLRGGVYDVDKKQLIVWGSPSTHHERQQLRSTLLCIPGVGITAKQPRPSMCDDDFYDCSGTKRSSRRDHQCLLQG